MPSSLRHSGKPLQGETKTNPAGRFLVGEVLQNHPGSATFDHQCWGKLSLYKENVAFMGRILELSSLTKNSNQIVTHKEELSNWWAFLWEQLLHSLWPLLALLGMVHLIVLFGSRIFNTLGKFIPSYLEAIKFHMILERGPQMHFQDLPDRPTEELPYLPELMAPCSLKKEEWSSTKSPNGS